jgi:hypothetical protein
MNPLETLPMRTAPALLADRRARPRLNAPGRRIADRFALLHRINATALRLALSLRAVESEIEAAGEGYSFMFARRRERARILLGRMARLALLGARID